VPASRFSISAATTIPKQFHKQLALFECRFAVVTTQGVILRLDEEYVARTENRLKTYERSLSESQPLVPVDEKPILLHEDILIF
jgi:hypothetical protein